MLNDPVSADLDRLAELEARATPPPWKVSDPRCAEFHRQLVGANHCPDGATIIERPPQSRAEAMECFFHALLVGFVSSEDAELIVAARNSLPSLLAELRAWRALGRRLGSASNWYVFCDLSAEARRLLGEDERNG